MDQIWAEYFQNILPMQEEMRAMGCQQTTETVTVEYLQNRNCIKIETGQTRAKQLTIRAAEGLQTQK